MTAAAAAALGLGDVVLDHAGVPALVLSVNQHGYIALLLLSGGDPGRQSGIAARHTSPVTGAAAEAARAAGVRLGATQTRARYFLDQAARGGAR